MFKDIKVIKNSGFKDNRGFLWTTWRKGVFNNIKFNYNNIYPGQNDYDVYVIGGGNSDQEFDFRFNYFIAAKIRIWDIC